MHNCITNTIRDYTLLYYTDVTEYVNILLLNARTVTCAPEGIP